MRDQIVPGDLFLYKETLRRLRPRSGVGQILGRHDDDEIVFIRLFDASGGELRGFIEFMPMTVSAYKASAPRVVKRLDLPSDWQAHRDEWIGEWRSGRAGVFSIPLHEVTRKTLETVDYFREFDSEDQALIELAFPKRSTSGAFDTIAAYVRTIGK